MLPQAVYTDVEFDTCVVCNDVGELIGCDECQLGFHPKCLGLESVPEGYWACPMHSCAACQQSLRANQATNVHCVGCAYAFCASCANKTASAGCSLAKPWEMTKHCRKGTKSRATALTTAPLAARNGSGPPAQSTHVWWLCAECSAPAAQLQAVLGAVLGVLLGRHAQLSEQFHFPIDLSVLTDYSAVVSHPICLRDIEKRVAAGEYTTVSGFTEDLELLEANCRAYCIGRFPAVVNNCDSLMLIAKCHLKVADATLGQLAAHTTHTSASPKRARDGLQGGTPCTLPLRVRHKSLPESSPETEQLPSPEAAQLQTPPVEQLHSPPALQTPQVEQLQTPPVEQLQMAALPCREQAATSGADLVHLDTEHTVPAKKAKLCEPNNQATGSGNQTGCNGVPWGPSSRWQSDKSKHLKKGDISPTQGAASNDDSLPPIQAADNPADNPADLDTNGSAECADVLGTVVLQQIVLHHGGTSYINLVGSSLLMAVQLQGGELMLQVLPKGKWTTQADLQTQQPDVAVLLSGTMDRIRCSKFVSKLQQRQVTIRLIEI